MKVCWFSTGISSFVACYLAKDVDEIIYTHVANQHPDSLRFLHDCEKLLGRKITVLQSDEYRDVDDVIEKTRCINTPFGAPCTEKLKKRVRMKWEREHPDHHIYVWGMDATEKNRAARLERTLTDYEHEFPLIEHNLTKEEAHGIRKVELVMRIISQDGRIDLPYEKVCLYIDSTLIIARCDNMKYIMGSYSNNEEAVKYMEMCRKHYAAAEYNRRIIPKGDTLVDMEKAKEFLTSGFIFQFPK